VEAFASSVMTVSFSFARVGGDAFFLFSSLLFCFSFLNLAPPDVVGEYFAFFLLFILRRELSLSRRP
jgi:hypothetical protein